MPEPLLQVTVHTSRFNYTDVKPHFINPCCFGEDFAAWLQTEIADLAKDGFELSEPIQEDYGWGIWASRGKDRYVETERQLMLLPGEDVAIAWCIERFGADGSGFRSASGFEFPEPDNTLFADEVAGPAIAGFTSSRSRSPRRLPHGSSVVRIRGRPHAPPGRLQLHRPGNPPLCTLAPSLWRGCADAASAPAQTERSSPARQE